jgi:hypothetical protein
MASNPYFHLEDPFFKDVESVPLNDENLYEEHEEHGCDDYDVDVQKYEYAKYSNFHLRLKKSIPMRRPYQNAYYFADLAMSRFHTSDGRTPRYEFHAIDMSSWHSRPLRWKYTEGHSDRAYRRAWLRYMVAGSQSFLNRTKKRKRQIFVATRVKKTKVPKKVVRGPPGGHCREWRKAPRAIKARSDQAKTTHELLDETQKHSQARMKRSKTLKVEVEAEDEWEKPWWNHRDSRLGAIRDTSGKPDHSINKFDPLEVSYAEEDSIDSKSMGDVAQQHTAEAPSDSSSDGDHSPVDWEQEFDGRYNDEWFQKQNSPDTSDNEEPPATDSTKPAYESHDVDTVQPATTPDVGIRGGFIPSPVNNQYTVTGNIEEGGIASEQNVRHRRRRWTWHRLQNILARSTCGIVPYSNSAESLSLV